MQSSSQCSLRSRCGHQAAHHSAFRPVQPVAVRPRCVAAASSSKLIVYTKPDCPLCDGLKDKVAGLVSRAQFMPCLLTSYTLEVRDVSTRDDWAEAYAHEVPVLATETDGKQVILPRPMPRITAERLQKHIEAALVEAQSATA